MTRAWLLLVAMLVGCAGELDPAEFAQCEPGHVERLFALHCGDGCHDARALRGSLNLVSPGVSSRLVGVVSQSDRCGGRALVDGDSGEGLLLDKLSEDPSCGAAMPFGRRKLSKFDVECVRRWSAEAAAGGGAP